MTSSSTMNRMPGEAISEPTKLSKVGDDPVECSSTAALEESTEATDTSSQHKEKVSQVLSAFVSESEANLDLTENWMEEDAEEPNKIEVSASGTSLAFARIRERELGDLEQAYQAVVTQGEESTDKSGLCLIHGVSGTGKSTLFRQFASQLKSPTTPFVLCGKFEELSGGNNPLSAIVEAFAGLSSFLHESDQDAEARRLQQRIQKAMGGSESIEFFAETFPTLKPLLLGRETPDIFKSASSTEDETQEDSIGASHSSSVVSNEGEKTTDASQESPKSDHEGLISVRHSELAWNKILYLFSSLVQTVATPEHPLVLFLDDIQWADEQSLELMQLLLRDRATSHMLLVGDYRTDEVGEDHPVSEMWKEAATEREDGSFATKIELENLTTDRLVVLIESSLRLQEQHIKFHKKKIQDLASALHEKTRGNIFFTMQVLGELIRTNVIHLSPNMTTWDWDLELVKTHIPNTVLEAVTAQIAKASEKQQKILTTAAYMRRTVDVESLELILSMEGVSGVSKQQIVEELDNAVAVGLLTTPGDSTNKEYSFAHDRIQQAAYEMIPVEDDIRQEYRYTLGFRLYQSYNFFKSDQSKAWMVLSAADHLNATCDSKKDAMFLVKLNLEAGQKCMAMAAFASAAEYLSYGWRFINRIDQFWNIHFDVAMDLCSALAEAFLVLGNMDQGRRFVTLVTKHAKTEMERLPTELALTKAMSRLHQHKEAFDRNRDTLRSMHLYPKTFMGVNMQTVYDLITVKRYFNKHTDEDILSLRKADNERLSLAVEFYVNMAQQAWFTMNLGEFLLATLKNIRVTLKHGIFPLSGTAFMSYSLFCDSMGDVAGAKRFSAIGLAMLERFKDQTPLCIQTFLSSFMIESFSRAPQQVAESLKKAYQIGMENGDLENAMMSYSGSVNHQYDSGVSLESIDAQYTDVFAKESIYNVETMKGMTIPQWLACRHLRGTADTPLDWDMLLEYEKDMKKDGTDQYPLLYAFNSRLQLGVYWGNYSFLEKLVTMYIADVEDRSHSSLGVRYCFMAIAYGSLYRVTRQKKLLRKGESFATKLKGFCEQKGMLSWHRYKLAMAHLQACQNTKGQLAHDAVISNYNKAIKLAEKQNHNHDAALGAQLVTEYLVLHTPDDQTTIEMYLEQACEGYLQWGAIKLVEHLQVQYAKYAENLLL